MFHELKSHNFELPSGFPSPFDLKVAECCRVAAHEVQQALDRMFPHGLVEGKMVGVLVVRHPEGKLGYLVAHSGLLDGIPDRNFFVPFVFDLLYPGGFFKRGEAEIDQMNAAIARMEIDPERIGLCGAYDALQTAALDALQREKLDLVRQRTARKLLRATTSDAAQIEAANRQSQHQKAEFKRLERRWQEQLAVMWQRVEAFEEPLEQLKMQRRQQSARLQQQIFNAFRFLNARGEKADLSDIFSHTASRVPPSGAGECAGPRLLQYAYLHDFQPVAMAEFWWGPSPQSEVRHHGQFYPACKGKCEPILGHMLKGLWVEEPEVMEWNAARVQLEVLFEDNWMVAVNKPHGCLSVPGRSGVMAVSDRLALQLGCGMLFPVHRLDMATSGILLLAKDKWTHQNLQSQFRNRRVTKQYLAILEGVPVCASGVVQLPICPDPHDRPRQMVCKVRGKSSVTRFEVLARNESHAMVAFWPVTGRTHQLRVHAAHSKGLGCPIAGDSWYGSPRGRLFLHASRLEWTHPKTGETLKVVCPAPFHLSTFGDTSTPAKIQ